MDAAAATPDPTAVNAAPASPNTANACRLPKTRPTGSSSSCMVNAPNSLCQFGYQR
ncbi:hypothetical protein Aglo01_40640 [Actinokineospora globicatena]|uniref:Uncharacterized protein n=1 Tax=Actinokineospora globicatena TaxID=103729 RepID=A0A9W6QIA1_9PSEU|nr:hypothetical protein Aglo01_40640 [Actinokineospora globicatena]GLW86007.1 hypothetical protein Aglo02_36470 [Actinokineospora globicatena]GLW90195.1 hypothetical protein Aglo03_10110 [Actinokineospora globicatena]